MAISSMGYKHTEISGDPEILYNSAYVGIPVTLDEAAFTDGVCLAGTPVGSDGTIANTASCAGIVLLDVYEDRPQATLVIGGYIKTAAAQEHSGVTIADEAKTALKNVVFM